jgi:hypothetical protein
MLAQMGQMDLSACSRTDAAAPVAEGADGGVGRVALARKLIASDPPALYRYPLMMGWYKQGLTEFVTKLTDGVLDPTEAKLIGTLTLLVSSRMNYQYSYY